MLGLTRMLLHEHSHFARQFFTLHCDNRIKQAVRRFYEQMDCVSFCPGLDAFIVRLLALGSSWWPWRAFFRKL